MLSLRRRHSRWRMFSILSSILFLEMICSGELAPVRVHEDTLSTSLSTSKKDIGSLSDYWQAWLLMDTQSAYQSGLDSASLLRVQNKKDKKSVFIAPNLPACAEGYQADKMGRCVKSISLNATAHKDFILERLKQIFNQTYKNEQKKSAGPLQVNIPLLPDTYSQPTEVKFGNTFAKLGSKPIPTRNETYFAGDEEKTKPHKINLHEVKNDTTPNKESTFFLGNSNVDEVERVTPKPLESIPAKEILAELIREMNDTNFSELVKYKMSKLNTMILNSSSEKRVNVSDGIEENVSMAEKRENSTEMSPAPVLLISPTKLTNVVDDMSPTQNDTAEQIAQTSNFTINTTTTTTTTTEESIIVSVPNSTLPPPAKQLTSIPLDEQRDNETSFRDELRRRTSETFKPNEEEETEFIYDEEENEEDYPYSTDEPYEDDFAEGEELLKHGEAGMTIPTLDVERLDRHQRQRNQNADLQKKMLDKHDQVMIHFNDSTPTEDKDDVWSNISSEVSIDGDFILETTLLDVNTERLQVATKSPDVTEKIVEDDSKELFGKSPDVVPEVVFSQDSHGAGSTSSHGRERIEQLSTRIKNKNEELEVAPSSSEPVLYDSPEEDPTTESRTTNEKRSHAKEGVLQKSPKDSQSNVPTSSPRQTTMNFDSVEDFVRFPVRQLQQGSYVRFPSSEANSIHNLSYKQNSRYPADNVDSYSSTSTKSSVPIRQKPVWFPYQTAPSWKPNQSQPDRVQETLTNERQNRRPDLMHFWSKMPLIRDPAIYNTYQNDQATNNDQEQPYNPLFRPRSSRRLSPITETSPESRMPTHKRRTPIGV